MRTIVLFFLFLSPLFSFENGVTYACVSTYRADVALNKEEQVKSYFEFYIKKDGSYLRTSAKRIYDLVKKSAEDKTYISKHKSNGHILYYRMKLMDKNSLMKSVSVPGYGKLISEYVKCSPKKIKKQQKLQ